MPTTSICLQQVGCVCNSVQCMLLWLVLCSNVHLCTCAGSCFAVSDFADARCRLSRPAQPPFPSFPFSSLLASSLPFPFLLASSLSAHLLPFLPFQLPPSLSSFSPWILDSPWILSIPNHGCNDLRREERGGRREEKGRVKGGEKE